jgi:hypothetical protein
MRYINLILLFDFIQVLISKRKHSTQDEYFPSHILFSTIYLLLEEILNHRNYFEREINMINFVYATNHNVHMHANMQCTNMHIFL